MRHIFIINPAAGKFDHTEAYSQVIERVCREHGLSYELHLSTARGDCTRIAREVCEKGDEVRLYACGGDGTLNEVVNGMYGFDNAAVTHFPGGSGNDTVKIFSETEPFHHLERLLDCEETRFDLIRCGDVHALNILSMGLDARIGTSIDKYKRIPLVTGKGAYVVSIVANLLKEIHEHYVVTLDGEVIDAEQTMICVCNGRWYGGGFNPVPTAQPDDGILDVLLVKPVNILQVAGVIGHYQKGRFRELPELITHYQCKTVRIECDKPSVVNVDGEAVTAKAVDICVEPQALRFFYPRALHYH